MSTTTTPASTLTAVRVEKDARDAAEIRMLLRVIDWAVEHEITEDEGPWGDCPLHLGGEGAPMVAEFAAYELAAVLEMSSDSGCNYIGHALELRYRLPRLWARVIKGEVPVWRAFRIADATRILPMVGARYVDTQLAWRLPKLTFAQQDRTVQEALVRFDPETAEAKRLAALEGRRFDVWTQGAGFDGTVDVTGCLGLSDALDLELAIAHGATALGEAGCGESLNVRRSMAAGVLARGDQTLNFHTDLQTRPMVIHVHDDHVGLLDNTRSPISVAQVAEWCGTATKVTIKPVIDLNIRLATASYVPTVAIAEHVRLRDRTCVFPRCARPSPGCDLDHIVSFSVGGETSTDNLAPLCRRHHRAKTHSRWDYVMVEPGTYQWTTPSGLVYDT